MATRFRAENTIRNIVWNYISMAVISIMPFIVRVLIIRCWDIEYVGVSSLFSSILNVLNMSELGIGEALVYSMYKPAASGDTLMMNKLLSVYNMFYKLFGLIIFFIGVILIPFIPRLIYGTYPNDINIRVVYFIFLIQAVCSYLFWAYAQAGFLANQDTSSYSKITMIVWFCNYLLQIFIIFFVKNYYCYIVPLPFATVLVNYLCYIILKRKHPEYKIITVEKDFLTKDFWKDFLQRTIGAALCKLRRSCRGSVDTVIISSMIGIVPVAIYNNYYMVMAVPNLFIMTLCGAILPSLGNGVAVESTESNYAVKKLISFIVHWMATIMCAMMLTLIQPFMELWAGKKNVESLTVAVLFTVLLYLLSIENVNNLIKSSCGFWEKGRWVPIVETLLNLSLNIVFAVFWGMEGILLATIISLIVINIPFETQYIYKYYYKKKSTRDFLIMFLDFFVTLIAVGVSYYISVRIDMQGWKYIVIVGFISILVSNIILLLFHIGDRRFKDVVEICMTIVKNKMKK